MTSPVQSPRQFGLKAMFGRRAQVTQPARPARSTLVLFKTHFWSAEVERQFERLQSVCANAHLLIFADQTKSDVVIPDRYTSRVIKRSEADISAYGLAHVDPGNAFWFSNDYPLLMVAIDEPDYNYYVMAEYDVVVRMPIDAIIDWMDVHGVDFAAIPNETPLERWGWARGCDGYYAPEDIVKYLNCLAFFKRKALFALLKRRLHYSRQIFLGGVDHFPNAEAFVATELTQAELRVRSLREIGRADHFDWSPSLLEEDLATAVGQTFLHPVAGAEKFVETTFIYDPLDYFALESALRKRVHRVPDQLFPKLFERLRQRISPGQIDVLLDDMRRLMSAEAKHRLGLDRVNIGRGRKAYQSSLCEFSTGENEAEDALNYLPNGNYSFHTAGELNPWWMVDLGAAEPVDSMRVFNREFNRDRASGLRLECSLDGENWTAVGQIEPGNSFGGLQTGSHTFEIGKTVRYLRLVLPKDECLHLDHVAVYTPGR